MEVKIASLVLFLCSLTFCHDSTTANRIYALRSMYRYTFQSTDCSLFRMEVNSKGEPHSVSYKGHCCDHKKHTDLKVVLSATYRGLEATFQWLHDTKYYLTAKSTGDQLSLEKPGSITNNHRFVIKSSNTVGCRKCVTIQSVATNRYLSSGRNGQVVMTTNRKLSTALFALHTCDPILMIMCGFMDVSC